MQDVEQKLNWYTKVIKILEEDCKVNPDIKDQFGKKAEDYDPLFANEEERKNLQKEWEEQNIKRKEEKEKAKIDREKLRLLDLSNTQEAQLLQKHNQLEKIQLLANEKTVRDLISKCEFQDFKEIFSCIFKEKTEKPSCQKLAKKCAKVFKDFHPDKAKDQTQDSSDLYTRLMQACFSYLKST